MFRDLSKLDNVNDLMLFAMEPVKLKQINNRKEWQKLNQYEQAAVVKSGLFTDKQLQNLWEWSQDLVRLTIILCHEVDTRFVEKHRKEIVKSNAMKEALITRNPLMKVILAKPAGNGKGG